jgi:inorganic pyrophosphatase
MREQSEAIDVVIEIPRGSRNKYEYDHESGQIVLDRVLFSSVHYPTDYGFVPGTKAPDGDALDVLVVVEEPTFPGCRMKVRPIGLLKMRDEEGEDEKLLAVPVADPRFDHIERLDQLQPHWLREIENFFSTYKRLERSKESRVDGWRGADEARQALRRWRI